MPLLEETNMADCKLRMLLVLLTEIEGSTVVQAHPPDALIHGSGVGGISFAAMDLKAALAQNGYTVTNLPLGAPPGATQSARINLTAQAATVPGMPTIAEMTNQAYAIQPVVAGSATDVLEHWNDVSGVSSPFSAATTNPA